MLSEGTTHLVWGRILSRVNRDLADCTRFPLVYFILLDSDFVGPVSVIWLLPIKMVILIRMRSFGRIAPGRRIFNLGIRGRVDEVFCLLLFSWLGVGERSLNR